MVGMAMLAGCEGPSAKPPSVFGNVQGKVVYKGEPVTEGMVIFFNKTLKSDVEAKLGAGGAYSATNLPLGNYAVTVRPLPVMTSMDASKPSEPPKDPANIPKKYRSMETSGFEKKIAKGDNTFDIEMKE